MDEGIIEVEGLDSLEFVLEILATGQVKMLSSSNHMDQNHRMFQESCHVGSAERLSET